MYVPKKIEPGKTYPIYILLSREGEVLRDALKGVRFCIAPGFRIDTTNKELKLYLHLSSSLFVKTWMKHYWLSSSNVSKILYKMDKSLTDLDLENIKPGAWKVFRMEVLVEPPEKVTLLTEPLRTSVEVDVDAPKDGIWLPWKDNISVWVERKYDDVFLVGVYERDEQS
ncbi:MAG TPA: hypothetical protein EYP39_06675 [Ghiorsea sp.]|nr:hypothetical protein [Ghiorsea sp.]HIP31888.1 hypothetical protein [Crocinitomicaceae bacterium]